MLTALIRTSYRPVQFARCIQSIPDLVNLIIAYDDERAVEYIRKINRFAVRVQVEKNCLPFGYNTYCNDLLDTLSIGHGIFLDDDDTMIRLPENLQPGVSYIVPFMRGKFEKPDPARRRQKIIQSGYIGLPCLILWHEHKEYVNFEAREDADYRVIQHLSTCVELEWRDTPIVYSEKRNHGVVEK